MGFRLIKLTLGVGMWRWRCKLAGTGDKNAVWIVQQSAKMENKTNEFPSDFYPCDPMNHNARLTPSILKR